MQGICRAHANIALIKYWGKIDEDLHIPYNNSLSLTQDSLYTDTKVRFSSDFSENIFILNGERQSKKETANLSAFVDIFREKFNINLHCEIKSYNSMPTAAGFGSSASAYAALAGAINFALELNLSLQDLSILARLGSGSACRSIFPGFVEWHKGTDNKSSFAESIDPADWGICTITVATDKSKKKLSSRLGMQASVQTSPFYELWPKIAEASLLDIKTAIKERDIDKIGQIAEHNALCMHSLTLSSKPAFTYFNSNTLLAMDYVKVLRKEGFTVHFTIDAGPNLVLICPETESLEIKAKFSQAFPNANLLISKAGKGIQRLESWNYEY